MYSSKYIKKALKTMNIDQHQYPKCPQSYPMCGHVENVDAIEVEVEVEVEAKVVEIIHQTTNRSTSARSMST